MKKQEYIQTHCLLAEVASHCQSEHGMPDRVLDNYNARGLAPTSIHYGKEHHKEAVLELATAIADWTDGRDITSEEDDEAAGTESVDSEMEQRAKHMGTR